MPQTAPLTDIDTLKTLYNQMVTAREMDRIEEEYTGRGEAFFHVSGAGHEASATLNAHLIPDDWLHVHYRDKALMIARGIEPRMFFMSLFNKDGSHSRGRQMNAHMSAPELKILSLVGPVGNSALQAAGVASVVKDQPARPIVLCGLGDGMTQQGEVLEAIGHAVREDLPVLFMVQDNAFAISTKTAGKTFYSTPRGESDEFYTLPVHRIDGRDPIASRDALGAVVAQMRSDRRPAIVVFNVDRLSNHTNADDQRMYRTAEEIAHVRDTGDPILVLRNHLLQSGVTPEELEQLRDRIEQELRATARQVQRSAEPQPTSTAVKPLPDRLTDPASEYTGAVSTNRGERSNGQSANGSGELTMLEAIREVLNARLASDERVQLFGEDLEDPKGDVFGITRGLTDKYGRRIMNSPLAEATILGVTVGQALAGKRPVAFLQFADFLPIAYNQIFAELGSMYWRTDGGWQVPVIVMVTCGGYRPGLGPFHASSMEGIAAHTPGIDVFMPSTAGDAAGLLNAAFESGRPTIFFYPKNCLNDRSATTSRDVEKQLVPIGISRTVRAGDDITLVGWGNTIRLCKQTAAALEAAGVSAEVIDLRSLVPWDIPRVVESVTRTGRLLVAHEDNHTAGMGAEVVATVSEHISAPIVARRVTRGDTYVPCNFANQLEILPSYKRILETAVDMLGGSVSWKLPEDSASGIQTVDAIGASPSDESVTVISWHIAAGNQISEGDMVAELEADKAAFDFKSSVSGRVEALLCDEGDTVKVGAPLFQVRTAEGEVSLKPVTREEPGEPVISLLASPTRHAAAAHQENRTTGHREPGTLVAGIAGIATSLGSRTVSNEEIAAMCPTWTPDDIVKRTGIESRRWVSDGENALTLATAAVRGVLARQELSLDEIDLLVCSTGTPLYTTPAMATLIQNQIAGGRDTGTAAYDISAACSGYLYGLQIAYDYLQSKPDHRVLLVTTEALSPKLDTSDPDTAPIFGDAATATVIVGSDHASDARFKVFRSALGAQGESGEALCVPITDGEHISMDGPTVYQVAVKSMIAMLQSACVDAGIGLERLDLIVPHQANQRIINAVRQRMKVEHDQVYSNIRHRGNTSSSTIPLCLAEILETSTPGRLIGLTAFGGGFTYAGGVIESL
ncbi:MAG: beta-ketoacyl-ACP synthase 3 [Spirochaetaceae bacterium]|nr:MAG: beta-ketoacyl-ACP synthase 3 [Spirochaetaceae bacterium]